MSTSKRGFAAMDPEKRREIASKGGKSVASENRLFSKDKALAALAGKKGGGNVPYEKRAFVATKGLAALAGKKGGGARK
jgi:general stress protein YciG